MSIFDQFVWILLGVFFNEVLVRVFKTEIFIFPSWKLVGLSTFIKEMCLCISIHFLSETAVHKENLPQKYKATLAVGMWEQFSSYNRWTTALWQFTHAKTRKKTKLFWSRQNWGEKHQDKWTLAAPIQMSQCFPEDHFSHFTELFKLNRLLQNVKHN